VYPCGTPRRSDAGIAEISDIPQGCGSFAVSLRCAFGAVVFATTVSSPRLALRTKLPATRTGGYFERGYSVN